MHACMAANSGAEWECDPCLQVLGALVAMHPLAQQLGVTELATDYALHAFELAEADGGAARPSH